MSGNREGGLKSSATVKQKYGKDFFANIGSIGGKNGNTGGFYRNREAARAAGMKGGRPLGHPVAQAQKDKFQETWRKKRAAAK